MHQLRLVSKNFCITGVRAGWYTLEHGKPLQVSMDRLHGLVSSILKMLHVVCNIKTTLLPQHNLILILGTLHWPNCSHQK